MFSIHRQLCQSVSYLYGCLVTAHSVAATSPFLASEKSSIESFVHAGNIEKTIEDREDNRRSRRQSKIEKTIEDREDNRRSRRQSKIEKTIEDREDNRRSRRQSKIEKTIEDREDNRRSRRQSKIEKTIEKIEKATEDPALGNIS